MSWLSEGNLETGERAYIGLENIGQTVKPLLSLKLGRTIATADVTLARNVLINSEKGLTGYLLLGLQVPHERHGHTVVSIIVNHEENWGLSAQQMRVAGKYTFDHGRNDHVPIVAIDAVLTMPVPVENIVGAEQAAA